MPHAVNLGQLIARAPISLTQLQTFTKHFRSGEIR